MTFHLQLCSKLSKVVLILDTCYMKQNNSSSVYSQRLNITFNTIKSTTFPFNTSFTLNIFVFSVKEYTARQTNHLSWIFCIMSDLWFDGTSNWGEAEERGGRGGHRQQGRPRFSSKSNHNKYLTSLFPRGNFVVKLNFMILWMNHPQSFFEGFAFSSKENQSRTNIKLSWWHKLRPDYLLYESVLLSTLIWYL